MQVIRNDTLDSYHNVTLGRDRYLRFSANPNARAIGTFALQLFAINTLVDQFDLRELTLVIKDDCAFKRPLSRLMKIDLVVPMPGGQLLPTLDLLNGDATSEVGGLLEHFDASARVWFDANQHTVDMFINDYMARDRGFCSYDRLAYLRVPDQDIGLLSDALIARGLKRDRWFVTVHAREPGYEGANAVSLRDQDPATFWPAIVHIVEKLGGQVVRLGHPAMRDFPRIEGLIDLSREPAPILLQTFAISRSRFLLAGPSGPSSLAACFHVPTAIVNALDVGPENDRAVFRTMKVVTPNGKRLSQAALFEAGYAEPAILAKMAAGERIALVRIGPEEIVRCAHFVYERTADTAAWREPEPADIRPRPNTLEWPGSTAMRGIFLPEDFR